MKKFLIVTYPYAIISIIFLSCNGKEESNPTGLLELNIDYSLAAKNLYLSDIVTDEIEIIPLSNTDANGDYFYMNSIDVFEKKEGQFFFLDVFRDGELRVFDPAGDFIRKTGSRGNGLGQYLQAMDFSLAEDHIEVLDVGKIHQYDSEGNFISSKKYKGFTAYRFQKLGNGYAFVASGRNENNLYLTDRELNVVSSHFPYFIRTVNALQLNPIFTNKVNKTIYRRSMNDTLFVLNNLQYPEPYLKIQYGDKAPNLSEFIIENEEKVAAEMAKSSRTLYFFESENYRFLSFFLNGEKWNYIYSNHTGKSVIFKNSDFIDDVTLDPSSYLVGVSGEIFYFLAKPEQVKLNFSERLLQKHDGDYIQKLKNVSENLDIEGNPVLFGVKFNF